MTIPATQSPVVCLLTGDSSLFSVVARVASEIGVHVVAEPVSTTAIIAPDADLVLTKEWAKHVCLAGVIQQRNVASVLLALRPAQSTLIDDPKANPNSLREFLRSTFCSNTRSTERRAHPRTSMGIRVESPPNIELLDISPYGARLLAQQAPAETSLGVQLTFENETPNDTCFGQIVAQADTPKGIELRVKFTKIAEPTQREILRIAKAQLFASSIRQTYLHCEQVGPRGFRLVVAPSEIRDVVASLAGERALANFSQLVSGRILRATLSSADSERKTLSFNIEPPSSSSALRVGDRVHYAIAGRFGTWLADGHVLRVDNALELTFPTLCAASDQRAHQRFLPSSDGAAFAIVDDEAFNIVDVSSSGISILCSTERPWQTVGRRLILKVHVPGFDEKQDAAIIRNTRKIGAGIVVGLSFLAQHDTSNELEQHTEVASEIIGSLPSLQKSEGHYISTALFIDGRDGRRIAGLWTETKTESGPRTLVIVPPAWAKTKESTTLFAQFMCATFDAASRHLAVLRIDYSNTIGESSRPPENLVHGREALTFSLTCCVEDIQSALEFAKARAEPEVVALVGMSFSGPLVLEVAARGDAVDVVYELMGASDIQDLVRRATGGLDYVGQHRSGLEVGLQNVLGLVSDTDRWIGDGIRANLVFLSSTQNNAAKYAGPIVWIHGQHDAFVSESRVRSVLASSSSPGRRLIVIPSGHVPTKTNEALLSYTPIAQDLLKRAGVDIARLTVPSESALDSARQEEWARAPRSALPSPRDYWRQYMLGENSASLGFEILAMTAEYKELMRLQIALLELQDSHELHDIGIGFGHTLDFLGTNTRVLGYDFVPELLSKATARANGLGVSFESQVWDAANDPPPTALARARRVLLSLFLSTLRTPERFLKQLWDRLPSGARVVASTMKPDADLSLLYSHLLRDIEDERLPAPSGLSTHDFVDSVRKYMNSAAWLLRLADEGTFHFFDTNEFAAVFERAGFRVHGIHPSFGTPPQSLVLVCEKS